MTRRQHPTGSTQPPSGRSIAQSTRGPRVPRPQVARPGDRATTASRSHPCGTLEQSVHRASSRLQPRTTRLRCKRCCRTRSLEQRRPSRTPRPAIAHQRAPTTRRDLMHCRTRPQRAIHKTSEDPPSSPRRTRVHHHLDPPDPGGFAGAAMYPPPRSTRRSSLSSRCPACAPPRVCLRRGRPSVPTNRLRWHRAEPVVDDGSMNRRRVATHGRPLDRRLGRSRQRSTTLDRCQPHDRTSSARWGEA